MSVCVFVPYRLTDMVLINSEASYRSRGSERETERECERKKKRERGRERKKEKERI